MKSELKQRIASILTDGRAIKPRSEVEAGYPKRQLSDGAEVTRFCPSPTGFVHVGSIYTALVCQFVAAQSKGVYILRIEDTDKKREVPGSRELIVKQLATFGLSPDEGLQLDGSQKGSYGPYLQSERRDIYLAYALDLLEKDRAYPCFATEEELKAANADQQAKKQRPGYYGEWALWRDKSDHEVSAALDANKPFVLRFRSNGQHDKRVAFEDVLKGKIELPENDLDVPLIKSDETRLPTYHLAHVVDDFLMQATVILRGEEWLPSTGLHIELAESLGFKPLRYAHLGLISVIDKNGGGKRKLSKRKDAEADIDFWLKAGYPIPAVKAYLLGLANSNFEDWYRENPDKPLEDFPFSLAKLAASRSPLLDMTKVEDYAKNYIASLPQEEFEAKILESAAADFKSALQADSDYTKAVLAIERTGDKPRKDMTKWSDVLGTYGYFFDSIFLSDFKTKIDEQLTDIPADVQKAAIGNFLKTYDAKDDQPTWLTKTRAAADDSGLSLKDFARILRVKLTGKNRTPDLWIIMQVMGSERAKNRLLQ